MLKYLLLLVLSFSTYAYHPPHKSHLNIVDGDSLKSDSGIRGPKFSEQVDIMKTTANKFENAKYIQYGASLKNKPLSALLFTPKSGSPKKLSIITGAIHGNEYLNIVDRLPEALLASPKKSMQKYLANGGAVLFVPIVNPDGYDRRRRGNSRWVDVNRDWPNPADNKPRLKQPESSELAKWIDDYVLNNGLKVDIAVDYHCCVNGTLLLPWGYKKGEHMSTMNAARSKKMENFFINSFKSYGNIGTPPDILYSAVGTTLDYWHEKYDAISFTYEGRRNSEQKYLPNHVMWWNLMFENL